MENSCLFVDLRLRRSCESVVFKNSFRDCAFVCTKFLNNDFNNYLIVFFNKCVQHEVVIVWQKGMDYQKLIHDYYQIKSNINNFAKVLPWIGNINININLNFLLHFRLAQHIHNMIGLKQLELTSSPLSPPSTFISTSPITPIKELKTTSRSLLKKKKRKKK